MSKIIVLMGAPGAGKGTQARMLQDRLGLPQISTGDIFRAMKAENTPLAEEVRSILASGKLVPDDVTIRVVEDRTSKSDCADGYILDGFPRTTAQAEMLEMLASGQGNAIQAVLVDVPADVLEKRTTGRRSCSVCGEIYNVHFKPPKNDSFCDVHSDTPLVHRDDDKADKIRVRLEAYRTQTEPLLDYYRASGRLASLDGTREPEVIYADVVGIVGER